MREALADALTSIWEEEAGEPLDDLDVFAEARDAYADALLPVVRRIVAEELRAAADWLERDPTFAAASLRDRADALDPPRPA